MPSGCTFVFSSPDAPDQILQVEEIISTGAHQGLSRALRAKAASLDVVASLVPMACNDSMSERAYGLDITMISDRANGTALLAGCLFHRSLNLHARNGASSFGGLCVALLDDNQAAGEVLHEMRSTGLQTPTSLF